MNNHRMPPGGYLVGGMQLFHTSIASEIRDKACDCRVPLFFIC